jgi:hypothetical protein
MFYDYSVMVIGRKRQTCQNRQPRTALTVLSAVPPPFFLPFCVSAVAGRTSSHPSVN